MIITTAYRITPHTLAGTAGKTEYKRPAFAPKIPDRPGVIMTMMAKKKTLRIVVLRTLKIGKRLIA